MKTKIVYKFTEKLRVLVFYRSFDNKLTKIPFYKTQIFKINRKYFFVINTFLFTVTAAMLLCYFKPKQCFESFFHCWFQIFNV